MPATGFPSRFILPTFVFDNLVLQASTQILKMRDVQNAQPSEESEGTVFSDPVRILTFLNQYRIGRWDWDLVLTFRSWFQELAMIIMIATLATILERPIHPIILENKGSLYLLFSKAIAYTNYDNLQND